MLGLDPFGDFGATRRVGDVPAHRRRPLRPPRGHPGAVRPAQGQDLDRRARPVRPDPGAVGAIRLARPNSPWARRRYPKRPRSSPRRGDARSAWTSTPLAWRDAFFDLIAGKPHLPSLPPAGAEPADDRSGRRKNRAMTGGAARLRRTTPDVAAPEGARTRRRRPRRPRGRRGTGAAQTRSPPRRRQVEPGGAVHLRELRRLARTRRPLHREGVAGDRRSVAVVLHGPGEDQLVPVRLDSAERLERPGGLESRLFTDLAARDGQEIDAGGAVAGLGRRHRAGSGPSSSARPGPWGCSTPRRPSSPSTGRRGAPAAPRPGAHPDARPGHDDRGAILR